MVAQQATSRAGLERADYWARLDSRILAAAACPRATLAGVSAEAGGAFPSVVAERLALHGIRLPEDEVSVEQAGRSRPGPELHAAEFEWYFTDECAINLADLIQTRSGEALLCGAPTVAAGLAGRGRRPTTVDRSAFLPQRFGSKLGDLFHADLRKPLGFLRSHPVVFFDAPWHEDHIARWLWQASVAVQRGGCIAFALFGELTRRAAREERGRLLALAESIGSVQVIEEELHYATPRFEVEALLVGGHRLQSPWRRGDLVIVENARHRIPVQPVPQERRWDTVFTNGRVVKLDPALSGNLPTVDWGQLRTLDTVSRSRIRTYPFVAWTSRNEILAKISEEDIPGHTTARLGC